MLIYIFNCTYFIISIGKIFKNTVGTQIALQNKMWKISNGKKLPCKENEKEKSKVKKIGNVFESKETVDIEWVGILRRTTFCNL